MIRKKVLKKVVTAGMMVSMMAMMIPQATAETASSQELTLTISDAVKTGLGNSLALKMVDKEIALSGCRLVLATNVSDSLATAEDEVDSAETTINTGLSTIATAQSQIDSARTLVSQGIAIEDIPLSATITIPKGSSISTVLAAYGLSSYYQTIINTLNEELDIKQHQLDVQKDTLIKGLISESSGSVQLEISKELIGNEISEKINMSSLDGLSAESLGSLLVDLAAKSIQVTNASKTIYRNQISLLIQKDYYDCLKAKKLLDLKSDAMNRAKKQYDFASDGYTEGVAAKDDMLLANLYYTSTKLEYQKAQSEYDNTLTELKKTMVVPFATKLVLSDVSADQTAQVTNLDTGIKSALASRLEIVKAQAQNDILVMNTQLVLTDIGTTSYKYIEAVTLREKSDIQLEQAKLDVESSVRESYETFSTVSEMLEDSKGMIEQAREALDIAQYRYETGFGADSSLLKQKDLQSANGTILGVISAQENLSNVEEKAAEITYSYNLAKMKYLSDIGQTIG